MTKLLSRKKLVPSTDKYRLITNAVKRSLNRTIQRTGEGRKFSGWNRERKKKNRRTETEIGSFGCTTEFGWALHREMAAAADNFGSPSTPASQAVQKSRSCHCRRRLGCCCCCRCTYSHCKRTSTHSHSLSLSFALTRMHARRSKCVHALSANRPKKVYFQGQSRGRQ